MMHDWKRLLQGSCLGVAIFIVACTESQNPIAGPAKDGLVAVQANESGGAGRYSRGAEDDILRIENAIPGFGGMFLDDDGSLVVYVPENANHAAVRSVLAREASSLHVSREVQGRLQRGERLSIKTGQFAFSQLVKWQTAAAKAVLAIPEVTAIDADERANRLTISAANADALAQVQAAVPVQVKETVADQYLTLHRRGK